MDLNAVMEIDHVIQVHHDGTVTDGPAGIHAPHLLDEELDTALWTLWRGYSHQSGYPGPIMHNSEYIGGRMAEHILETPGVYVAVAAYWSPWVEDGERDELLVEGWALAQLCGHIWVSADCHVHTEDLAQVYAELRGTGQRIECQHCETAWRPGVYAG